MRQEKGGVTPAKKESGPPGGERRRSVTFEWDATLPSQDPGGCMLTPIKAGQKSGRGKRGGATDPASSPDGIGGEVPPAMPGKFLGKTGR